MNPIRHIEFWSSNIEKSMAFYESFLHPLGWSRTDKNSLTCDQVKIYFKEVSVGIHNTIGPRHICFNASDCDLVDMVAGIIKLRGALILHEPSEIHPGSYMLVFKDFDGYILEIACKI